MYLPIGTRKMLRLVQLQYNVRCYNIDSIEATQERRNHTGNYIWCAMIFKWFFQTVISA